MVNFELCAFPTIKKNQNRIQEKNGSNEYGLLFLKGILPYQKQKRKMLTAEVKLETFAL